MLADIRAFEAAKKKRALYNYTEAENREWEADQIYKLKEKHYLQNQQTVAGLEAELEKARLEYEKRADPNKSLAEFTKWKTRYSSMGKERLIEEASAYLQNDSSDWTVERLDSLNEALTREKVKEVHYAPRTVSSDGTAADSGPVEKHSFSEWMQLKKAYQPWLKEKPEVQRALELYSAPLGKMRILEENGVQIQEFNLEEAIQK